MATRLRSIENEQVSLEVAECECGYHFTVDVTFLEQLGDFWITCPACGEIHDTAQVFPEAEEDVRQRDYAAVPRVGD